MSGKSRYMMATKAIHKLGDISRDKPDLCVVHDEDKENYIGNWVTGFGFINVKFPKSTTRELTEEEKEHYHGMQVVIGDGPVGRIYTKEPKEEDMPKEAPIISLPNDETRREQVQKKLKEYRGRMQPYRAPELQMENICKIAVLERLLRDGQVNTWDFSRKLAEEYGSGFNSNDFSLACAVIDDYCKTGGANLRGGTGLPSTS